jgi:hypothetical protein
LVWARASDRAVSVLVEWGNWGDALTDPRAVDPLAEFFDDAGHFIAEPRWECGLDELVAREVVAAHEGELVAIHPCRPGRSQTSPNRTVSV